MRREALEAASGVEEPPNQWLVGFRRMNRNDHRLVWETGDLLDLPGWGPPSYCLAKGHALSARAIRNCNSAARQEILSTFDNNDEYLAQAPKVPAGRDVAPFALWDQVAHVCISSGGQHFTNLTTTVNLFVISVMDALCMERRPDIQPPGFSNKNVCDIFHRYAAWRKTVMGIVSKFTFVLPGRGASLRQPHRA
ncbi:hypothetical protein DFS34DRAFT_234773 [Phlyctochytrium arcticum]|nr:hypothetical protein DFS34DRAFT_234773 [Phlyctochytrium arcticum]